MINEESAIPGTFLGADVAVFEELSSKLGWRACVRIVGHHIVHLVLESRCQSRATKFHHANDESEVNVVKEARKEGCNVVKGHLV